MEYFYSFDKISYLKTQNGHGCVLCMIRDKFDDVIDLTIYEDELFIVSLNLYPYNPGHLLIFPRRHILDVREFTEEEDRRQSKITRLLLDVLDRTYSPFGYNIGYNLGRPAGASIDHIHQHIIPRYPGELGVAELLSGKKVLVENPLESAKRLKDQIAQRPSSMTSM